MNGEHVAVTLGRVAIDAGSRHVFNINRNKYQLYLGCCGGYMTSGHSGLYDGRVEAQARALLSWPACSSLIIYL